MANTYLTKMLDAPDAGVPAVLDAQPRENGSKNAGRHAVGFALRQMNLVLYVSGSAGRNLRPEPAVERLRLTLAAGEAGEAVQLLADATRLAVVARWLDLRPNDDPSRLRAKGAALPKWRLKRALEYVEAHLAERITLADLASATGLSRMYFAAQFRAAMGIRPREYLLRRRIARAQDLLSKSRMTLVEIALSVGFQTQAYFTTVFKRFVGETPHQWRRQNHQGT
jgi:AraC-like DNA-binding protein